MENKNYELEVISLFEDLQENLSKCVEENLKENIYKNILVISNLKYMYPFKNNDFESASVLRIVYCKNPKVFFQEDAYFEIYGFHKNGEVVVSEYLKNLKSNQPKILNKHKLIDFDDADFRMSVEDFLNKLQ
jgi:hypothetical protein